MKSEVKGTATSKRLGNTALHVSGAFSEKHRVYLQWLIKNYTAQSCILFIYYRLMMHGNSHIKLEE